MDGSEIVREAEPLLAPVLRCVEADQVGDRLVVAEDLLKRADLYRSQALEACKVLGDLLQNPRVSNADIKGMLKRIDVGWNIQSPFGAGACAARKHLEAARDALERWTRRR